jgi:hypothetical protein
MKKPTSQRFVPQLAAKLAAKPSELTELLGVSRNYLHKLSTGQRPLTGRVLETLIRFEQHTSSKKPNAIPTQEIPKTNCLRRVSVIQKKINDLMQELDALRQTEEALGYVTHLRHQLVAKSLEHDWCVLHLRRLKHRLPKQPELQRAEWEAKLSGLHAEKKYWEKKAH